MQSHRASIPTAAPSTVLPEPHHIPAPAKRITRNILNSYKHARRLTWLAVVSDHFQQGRRACSRTGIYSRDRAPRSTMATASLGVLRSLSTATGQDHLLDDWDLLSAAEQQELAADIQAGGIKQFTPCLGPEMHATAVYVLLEVPLDSLDSRMVAHRTANM